MQMLFRRCHPYISPCYYYCLVSEKKLSLVAKHGAVVSLFTGEIYGNVSTCTLQWLARVYLKVTEKIRLADLEANRLLSSRCCKSTLYNFKFPTVPSVWLKRTADWVIHTSNMKILGIIRFQVASDIFLYWEMKIGLWDPLSMHKRLCSGKHFRVSVTFFLFFVNAF